MWGFACEWLCPCVCVYLCASVNQYIVRNKCEFVYACSYVCARVCTHVCVSNLNVRMLCLAIGSKLIHLFCFTCICADLMMLTGNICEHWCRTVHQMGPVRVLSEVCGQYNGRRGVQRPGVQRASKIPEQPDRGSPCRVPCILCNALHLS